MKCVCGGLRLTALLAAGLALPVQAQFWIYTAAIPQRNPSGIALSGANTTFADGTIFQPDGDAARSSKWTWRAYGDGHILSSLGPNASTPPVNAKELVTTVSGLEPGKSYRVQVLFWSTTAGGWGVRAGVQYAHGTHTNAWFDNTGDEVSAANLLPWINQPPLFSESGRTLYAGQAGIATANAEGQVDVFVHGRPATDANQRTWYQGVAVALVAPQHPFTVDCAAAGTHFHRGVRGLALADDRIDQGGYQVGIPRTLEVARGSAIRGVATGLAADVYDWRVRNYGPRPPTLEFLRYSRDFSAELWMGLNLRGLIQPDGVGGNYYYDTQPSMLAALAADWVRYVNHIVPSYRQGDAVTEPRDAAILASLIWRSSFPGDSFDTLLAPGEAAVPHITYWEIGNEPTVGVTAYLVTNSYTLDAAAFHERYQAVAQAVKAEDPTVKVGPTLVNGSREETQLAAVVSDSTLPLDFITYHPYERMGVLTNAVAITRHLGSIFSRQQFFLDQIRRVVADNGRNPDDLEYAATEVNVSYWDTNDTDKEARIAHALGTVETVFAHARLGLVASHYWIWPMHNWAGTLYPNFKAYEKLRDYLGDTLLANYAWQDLRAYATRESRTGCLALWGLNFSGTENATLSLQLDQLPHLRRATLLRLQDTSGNTTLDSANLAAGMPGGPVDNVDWIATDLTGQDLTHYQLALPAATLSLLILEPGFGRLSPAIVEQGETLQFSVTAAALPYAFAVRYRLLRSPNLNDWEEVGEAVPDAVGQIQVTDPEPIHAEQKRFYRLEMF